MQGRHIVFEGVDNSGKSTASSNIAKWLKTEHQLDVVLTKHPGSTEAGREIRALLKHSPFEINPNAQALLFAADNSLFMSQVLKPMLDQHKWVISDRNNFISSLAYQIASGCSLDELDRVHAATEQTAQIDLLLIFQCDWTTSQRRRQSKVLNEPGKDRYEDSGREYFEKLVNCYDRLWVDHYHRIQKFVKPLVSWESPNVHVIDASREQDEVFNDVKAIIEKCMRQWQ